MVYDEGLAERLRDLLPKATEKKMFGGIGWMERGNLVVGVHGDDMIVRLGPDAGARALKESGVRPFDVTGKPMSGWVFVAQEELAEDEDILRWLKRCRSYTDKLPAK